MSQPAVNTKVVFEELQAQNLKTELLDSFTLRRLKKEASALLHADPAAGYAALGIISAFESNSKEFTENFSKSFSLSTKEEYIYINYLLASERLGLFSLEVETAKNILSLFPKEKEVAAICLNSLFRMSHYQFVIEYLKNESWHELTSEELKVFSFLKENNFISADMEKINDISGQLIADNAFQVFNITHKIQSDPESSWLTKEFYLIGNEDEVIDLNFTFSEILAEADNLSLNNLVVIFNPATGFHH